MTFLHLNVKTGTRADGQSAVAKYEYISRIGKYSLGFHDDVVHVESGNMPAFAASDPRLYWATADEYERSNGRLFRSLTGALPNALDFAARLALARSFAVEVTGRELPYTLALHAGDVNRGGVPDNPHFHLVFSERVNDGVLRAAEAWFRRAAAKGKDPAVGGARKSTRTKPREWLVATRHGWAAKLNGALERAGIAERVTAESHETLLGRAAVAGDVMEMERLVLNPPAPHIGPSAKHRWEDRDLEEQADRYAQHEQAVERAWSIWWTHTKQIAEAEVGWAQVEALDVRIAELEAEQRVDDAAAEREERERQEVERRVAEERRRADVEEREAAVDAVSQGHVWRREEQQEVLAGAERPLTLDEREGIVERVERRIGEDLDRREGEIGATAVGATLLEEMSGAGDAGEAPRSLAARARIVEKVEQRVDKDLRDREKELRSIAPGEQYLDEAKHALLGGSERQPTFAERESMVTTAGQRLEKELDDREVRFIANGGSHELLTEAFFEVCGADEPSGAGPSLSERSQLITLAEQWHAEDRAADAEWSARLDSVEAMLRATSIGAGHLSAAQQQEVVNAGRDPSSLETRETVVNMARRRVEQELDDREVAVSSRRCAAGSAEVDGAGLYTGKLAELEAGVAAEGGSPHPAHREQALVWAERQIDRLGVLGAAEALDPFFRTLAELGSSRSPKAVERSLDHAEDQLRQAASRRQARIDALSEDERVFFDKQLDVLEPSWRETRRARPANIDEALDYAGTQLAALDRNIERRRVDIHETPGDGYARLLRAGFERESRQGKVRALTAVETYLRKNFEQQEEKIRTDEEGEAFLRRGRVEVLETDREPETLAERGRVIERAEALRQAAMAERKRQAAAQRVARLKRLFAVPGGDKAFFALIDAQKPTWRQTGTSAGDVDIALDIAERSVDRRKTPAAAEHKVVVEAERKFPDTPSAAWRQVGERFHEGSTAARVSQRLSDRARACALAAEWEEPPASRALVRRLFEWLRTQIDKLRQRLRGVKPVTRQPASTSGAAAPAQPVVSAATTPGAGTPSRSIGGPPVPAVSGSERRETERQAVDERHHQKAEQQVEHWLHQKLEHQLAEALPRTRDVYMGGKTHYGTTVEAVSDQKFDAVDSALGRDDAIDNLARERMRNVRQNLHGSPEMRAAAEWQHRELAADVRSAETAERVRIAKERSQPASWLRREKIVEPHLVELSDDQRASARQTAHENLVERIVRKSRDLCRSFLDRDRSVPELTRNAGASVGAERSPVARIRRKQQRNRGRTESNRGH